MGVRRYTGTITLILWIIAIALLVFKGLNFGLDFTGGTQIEARFAEPASVSQIRQQLEAEGFHGIRVQQYGSTRDVLIRISSGNAGADDTKQTKVNTNTNATTTNNNINRDSNSTSNADKQEDSTSSMEQTLSAKVKAALVKKNPTVVIRRAEFVGSEVGAQLFEQGGIAVLVSILATMVYIALRFEYRLAVSAAVGLCHDAVLILGIFSLFGFEFDLSALGSILAVLGYSLNDTIVVFDRVRENFRKVRKGTPVEIMNLSINQTLSRTIMTSWMTLLVVLALLIFGGETLFGFSIAFFIGIIIGTFSSIYVSGALALWMGLTRTDLLPKVKTAIDDNP